MRPARAKPLGVPVDSGVQEESQHLLADVERRKNSAARAAHLHLHHLRRGGVDVPSLTPMPGEILVRLVAHIRAARVALRDTFRFGERRETRARLHVRHRRFALRLVVPDVVAGLKQLRPRQAVKPVVGRRPRVSQRCRHIDRRRLDQRLDRRVDQRLDRRLGRRRAARSVAALCGHKEMVESTVCHLVCLRTQKKV